MTLLSALAGLLVGCLLNVATRILPRASAQRTAQNTPNSTWGACPLLYLLPPGIRPQVPRQPDTWLRLDVGVTLLTSLVFASVSSLFGYSWPGVLLIVGYLFFMLIAIIDLRYRVVPNVLTYPAIAAILVIRLAIFKSDGLVTLLGGAMAFLIFLLTSLLRPGDLGGGDVKLATLIGFTFGFPQVMWALLLGAGVGALVTSYLLLVRSWDAGAKIPYAPFLCLGAVVVLSFNVAAFANGTT